MSAISDDEKRLRELQNIFSRKFGIDLSNYGFDFIKRRIERRLDDLGFKTYSEYLAQLIKDPNEHKNLLQTLSVEVTEFFRDPDLFKALSGVVLPAIGGGKNQSGMDSIRGWSAGCATGEEAYTMAMVIDFFLFEHQLSYTYHVSASDVNEQFLTTARNALYSKEKVQKIPWVYRGRYFSEDSSGRQRLIPQIRHSVKFFKHDLLSKQIIPNNDLILCRNVLIYMSPEKRDEIVDFFYECLLPGGFLILGGTESIVKSTAFETVDVKNCIYRKIGGRSRVSAAAPKPEPAKPAPKTETPAAKVAPAPPVPARNIVVIGASTGGPKVLKNILSKLPPDLNAAVLVVQHLSSKFSGLVVAGLSCTSKLPIKLAESGDPLLSGQILFTPGDTSVRVVRSGDGGKVELTQEQSPHKIQPWIDLAMESAAEVFKKRCVAVLLTGMGADGAMGMMRVKKLMGETFAQDEASSMIFGMPKEAIKSGTVDHVLNPKEIPFAIKEHIDSLG